MQIWINKKSYICRSHLMLIFSFLLCELINQIYSNGKYKSVLHRVIVNAMKKRTSVASLHSLPFNCTVRPSPKLIDEANPKRYADTNFDTFLAYVSTREPKRKEFLDSRKLTSTWQEQKILCIIYKIINWSEKSHGTQ